MSEEMKDSPRFDFKEAWIIAAVSVLVVYLIGQLRPESELGAIATGGWLLVWMTLLSFPSSLLFLFFIFFFAEMDDGQDFFDVLFIWIGLFSTGYLQWCRFVPSMLDREFITLDLESKCNRAVGQGRADSDLASDLARQPEMIERSSTKSNERP